MYRQSVHLVHWNAQHVLMHCALYKVQWVGNVNNANNVDLSTRRMRDMFLLYIHLYILYIHTYIATGML